jgi:tRNA dimethylallyltransferase
VYSNIKNKPLLIILGPTASGKTHVATQLASQIHGEIISADSRQVYRDMNIGTGKDLDEFFVNGKQIPYHLIDIADAGTQYNIHQYQNDFIDAYQRVLAHGAVPIVCGGSGLYIHALLEDYRFTAVPIDQTLRDSLDGKSHEVVLDIFEKMNSTLHAQIDVSTRKRLVRGIEIAQFAQQNPVEFEALLAHARTYEYVCIGLNPELNLRRAKISKRLATRLNAGLIEEVQALKAKGLTDEQLIYYGLEYKYVTQYLRGELTKPALFTKLETEIHRFAKRQMTFFRKMEKDGVQIHWMDPAGSESEMIQQIMNLYQSKLALI